MEHLIAGVRDAVAKESWYGALALALALPDACSAIESPGRGRAKVRYATWANKFVTNYTRDQNGHPFLTGDELYLVRCAFLHQGDFAVDDESPQAADDSKAMFEVLNHVRFFVSDLEVVPARGLSIAAPTRTTSYSVGVVDLCEWICRAAEDWLAEARTNSATAEAIEEFCRTNRIMSITPRGWIPI